MREVVSRTKAFVDVTVGVSRTTTELGLASISAGDGRVTAG